MNRDMNRESDHYRNECRIKNSWSHRCMYWLFISSLSAGFIILVIAMIAVG